MTSGQYNSKLYTLRLSPKADNLLRKHVRRRGDVARLIIEAVDGTDLESITAESRWSRSQKDAEYINTSIHIPLSRVGELVEVAKQKKVSVTALIEAAIIGFYTGRDEALASEDEDREDEDCLV